MRPESYDLTNNTCLIFNQTVATVAKVRLTTAMVGLFVCIVATIVIVYTKLYIKFTHRLYLYLTVANAIYSATFILQFLAVDYEEKIVYHAPCTAAGFLMQYTGWVVLLFTSIITFHLSTLIIWNKNFKNRRVEVTYVLFGFGFPLVFCWIPFINQTYGLTGDWCWIRWANYIDADSTTGECPRHLEGIIENILLWGVPLTILVIVSFITAVIMIVVLIKRGQTFKYDDMSNKHKTALKEALPYLTYPILFYLICIFEIVHDVYNATHLHDPNYGLWMVNAMLAPMRAIPIIVALMCPGGLVKIIQGKEIARSFKPIQADTTFSVGNIRTSQAKERSKLSESTLKSLSISA